MEHKNGNEEKDSIQLRMYAIREYIVTNLILTQRRQYESLGRRVSTHSECKSKQQLLLHTVRYMFIVKYFFLLFHHIHPYLHTHVASFTIDYS